MFCFVLINSFPVPFHLGNKLAKFGFMFFSFGFNFYKFGFVLINISFHFPKFCSILLKSFTMILNL